MTKRDMEALMALVRKHLGAEYVDLVAWLRDENSLAVIEQHVARGDYMGAIQNADAAAKKLAGEIHESYVTSGRTASDWLDQRVQDRLIRFEANSPAVVQRARTNELALVTGFRDERNQIARQITQRAIVESATLGTNPKRVAQDFRDSIGLTPGQEQWVANYRRALESGDYTGALGYELSSGTADRSVRSAAEKGKALTPDRINTMVEQYRQNAIAYRAETIARTEALRNAHEGADDAMRQAIARGDIDAEQLETMWHAGPATLDAREQHQALNEVTVPFGQDFVLSDGTRMSGPGDPRGGAKHTANCRCTKSTAFAA